MRKNRISLIALSSVLLVAALLVSVGSGCGKPEDKVFKIASIAAMSGSAAEWGIVQNGSLEIAVEDINAAGGIKVNGDSYTMEAFFYDHQYDPTIAATVARKAIYDDGLKVIHTWSEPEIQAMYPMVEKEEVIILTASSATGVVGRQYPLVWSTFPHYPDSIEVVHEYAAQKHPNLRRTASFFPDTAAGIVMADDWRRIVSDFGFEIVDEIFIPVVGMEDFYPPLTSLLAKGVDIIEPSQLSPQERATLMKQARELGFEGIFIQDNLFDFTTLSETIGWEAIEGTIGGPEPIRLTTDIGKSWRERFQERTGSPELWPAYVYDSTWLLKLAIEKANSFDTQKIMEAMETVSYDGIFGLTKYGGEDIPEIGLNRVFSRAIYVVEIVNGEAIEAYSAMAQRAR